MMKANDVSELCAMCVGFFFLEMESRLIDILILNT